MSDDIDHDGLTAEQAARLRRDEAKPEWRFDKGEVDDAQIAASRVVHRDIRDVVRHNQTFRARMTRRVLGSDLVAWCLTRTYFVVRWANDTQARLDRRARQARSIVRIERNMPRTPFANARTR